MTNPVQTTMKHLKLNGTRLIRMNRIDGSIDILPLRDVYWETIVTWLIRIRAAYGLSGSSGTAQIKTWLNEGQTLSTTGYHYKLDQEGE